MDSSTTSRVPRPVLIALVALLALTLVLACGGGPATEAVPTPTSSPVPTAAPTATLVPTQEATSSPIASPDTLAAKVWDTAVMLAEELSPRESATNEELRAAEYLAGRFSGWGYEVGLQDFEAVEIGGATRLVVIGPGDAVAGLSRLGYREGDRVWIFAFPVDPSSLAADGYEVEGAMTYAGRGTGEDFSGVDLQGKIALIEGGGGVSLREKVEGAGEAGAEAAVIFNEEPNAGASWGRVYQDTRIPAIGIGNREGRGLLRALETGGGLEVRVSKAPLALQPSRNVVVELNNDIEDDETLVIGAHYDTTPGSSGANDNGSGVAAALVVAEELSDDELPFDLRFVLFGSEEIGLNGSFAYVGGLGEGESEKILAMINLDVVGTGELTGIGTEIMVELAVETAADIGFDLGTVDLGAGYGSDHIAFMLAGIDVIFLFADDVTYINSPLDTLEHLQPKPLAQSVELTLEIIERLAEQ